MGEEGEVRTTRRRGRDWEKKVKKEGTGRREEEVGRKGRRNWRKKKMGKEGEEGTVRRGEGR